MNKVYIQNLGMIITNKCNLNCAHCMRGCKNNKDMSKEVIEATLDQIKVIGNLAICGGEPTMALDSLYYIFNYITKNKILLESVSVVINGTRYNKYFLMLLEYIDYYISCYYGNGETFFNISFDKYHLDEIKRLNMLDTYNKNIEKYKSSKFFNNLNILPDNIRIYREGNALNLDKDLTIDLRPIDIVVAYPSKFKKNNNKLCNIGPLMSVNVDGIITECDASLENQETKYNYGNVLYDSLEEVALKRGKLVKARKWEKETNKVRKKYLTYNK